MTPLPRGGVLVVDNYDSFTWNLVQYLGELGVDSTVVRNDAVSVAEIAAAGPACVVISPGPKTPAEAGICIDLVRTLGPSTPIFGVCLGHQAIGEAYGGVVVRAAVVMHGKVSQIEHEDAGAVAGLPRPFAATRYHSLIVERETLPEELEITCWTDDGTIMGLRHRRHPVEGVQFHPESIGTPEGRSLLRNVLHSAGIRARD